MKIYFIICNIENFFHENALENIIRLSKYFPVQQICDSELRLELISILSSESLKTKTFLRINSFYKHLMSNFQCNQLWKLFKVVTISNTKNF